MFDSIRTGLQGYKTYIVVAVAVLTALLGFINGEMDAVEAVLVVLNALGIGTLRAGVKRDTNLA